MHDTGIVLQRHERFVKKICESLSVFALEDSEGLAMSTSNDYENENDEAIDLICFWSEKALAEACIKEDWKGYEVVEILLAEFLESYCVEMSNDGFLAGTDFDPDMLGFETDPLELVLEVVAELKKSNQEMEFEKFDDLSDLEEQVREILEM